MPLLQSRHGEDRVHMPTGVEEAWLALIGAIMGTSGLKVVEHILSRAGSKETLAKALRDELKQEIAQLKKEIDETEDDVDHWKQRYYSLIEAYIEQSSMLMGAAIQLKEHGQPLDIDTKSLTELLAREIGGSTPPH
jgi:hypothetical protein